MAPGNAGPDDPVQSVVDPHVEPAAGRASE
jgi:hypothetical protein